MKIMLAIKTEYVERIFNGTKKYEYRKTNVPQNDVKEIHIYETSPTKKVVGKIEVLATYSAKPRTLWDYTKLESGMSREEFKKYFGDSCYGRAFKLGSVTRFNPPKKLSDYGLKAAPQSFCFLEDEDE